MRVSMVGTGYVGLVSGVCFAELGHHVTCIDLSKEKINLLSEGKSPIYEQGLSELLERNIRLERINFSTSYDSIKSSKCIFLAVGTPSSESGEADLSYLFSAAESIADVIQEDAIVVIKSTVPVGTYKKVYDIISSKSNCKFHLVNNPEFLKEGNAIGDFMKPDRVVIGASSDEAFEVMDELYDPLFRQGKRVFRMSNISAELTKYASNCFLATKISFINEVANLCDCFGADIEEVRRGMTSDKRIGNEFLFPGLGYGGSCFPKDVKALIHSAKTAGFQLKIVGSANEVNESQKLYMVSKLKDYFGDLNNKTIAFWGVAFKPNTDDVREAPAGVMAREIIKAGGKVHFYDPVAKDTFQKSMKEDPDTLVAYTNKYNCLENADALVVVTEWAEFRAPDFYEIKERLNSPVLFDGRNIYDKSKVTKSGLKYYAVGKYIPENDKKS